MVAKQSSAATSNPPCHEPPETGSCACKSVASCVMKLDDVTYVPAVIVTVVGPPALFVADNVTAGLLGPVIAAYTIPSNVAVVISTALRPRHACCSRRAA